MIKGPYFADDLSGYYGKTDGFLDTDALSSQIEKVIQENEPAKMDNMGVLADTIKTEIMDFLLRYDEKNEVEIVKERYQRFRNMGVDSLKNI